MKFEHLIEVNDPLNPLMDTLTREQVWRGLVIRAESPKLFIPHLDECDISAREAGSFKRRLRYGDLVVEDTVLLTPLHEVRYEVPAQGDISASRLTMTIEAPSEHMLYVRFSYDDGMGESTDGATKMYEEFKKSAYQEADIDTMRIVRQMAEQGNLDASYLN
ncbi:SRPBCC family protein [Massilia sp. CMS3.1]|uniref:SRPBCC family protein n=1 Tax=Massilia sp. CMS3.1 TaxID=3373083 RepID=UPI003EE70EAC